MSTGNNNSNTYNTRIEDNVNNINLKNDFNNCHNFSKVNEKKLFRRSKSLLKSKNKNINILLNKYNKN